VRLKSILAWTTTFHMWHTTDVTAPQPGRVARNQQYLNRPGGLIRCRNGLLKRSLRDLHWRVVGAPLAEGPTWLNDCKIPAGVSTSPEVEIVVSPGAGCFSGQADCNILVALNKSQPATQLAQQAHLIVTDAALARPDHSTSPLIFPLSQLEDALKAVA
jgi:hypothetical protein